jgi:hypothetical protein
MEIDQNTLAALNASVLIHSTIRGEKLDTQNP